jgi:hypothetical protein
VYTTREPNAPMNVFIHGGAWRAGRSADSAYLSENFVDSGAHFIAVLNPRRFAGSHSAENCLGMLRLTWWLVLSTQRRLRGVRVSVAQGR